MMEASGDADERSLRYSDAVHGVHAPESLKGQPIGPVLYMLTNRCAEDGS